jgi:hypothetical protein
MKKGLSRVVSLQEMRGGKRQGVKALEASFKKVKEAQEGNANFERKLAIEQASGGLGVIR